MVLLAACLLMAPQSVPSYRILSAAGVGQTPITPMPAGPSPQALTWTPAAPATSSVTGGPNAATSAYPLYAPSTANARVTLIAPPAFAPQPVIMPDITFKLRAFNAIATMIIGLLGCLLGVLAYRRARPNADLS